MKKAIMVLALVCITGLGLFAQEATPPADEFDVQGVVLTSTELEETDGGWVQFVVGAAGGAAFETVSQLVTKGKITNGGSIVIAAIAGAVGGGFTGKITSTIINAATNTAKIGVTAGAVVKPVVAGAAGGAVYGAGHR